MQTKVIDTKYKEIYFNPSEEQTNVTEDSFDKVLHIMDLMALQNKAFMCISR